MNLFDELSLQTNKIIDKKFKFCQVNLSLKVNSLYK